ncbi:peptide-methionine (R)-S-oxide reductase [Gymnodinialimonas sp.]
MTDQSNHTTSRRAFLGSAAVAALGVTQFARTAEAQAIITSDNYTYEIQRTEAEWRAMLTDEEYRILREVGTEARFSSELWEEERDGTYFCRGCDLPVYDNTYKEVLFVGWVFFDHSFVNATMTGIDILPAEYGGTEEMATTPALMETHCRRCGSHLGHILTVEGKTRHCINGAALRFELDAA